MSSDGLHELSRGYLVECRAVLTSSIEDAVTPDEQLEEVIHVRIENETVESEPLLQPQPSLNVSHPRACFHMVHPVLMY